MNASTIFTKPLHPFYPIEIELGGYVENYHSTAYLLSLFAAGSAFILLLTGYITKLQNPRLPTSEAFVAMWFVLSGSIHLFFEGYYAYNFQSIDTSEALFGEMWKEYALADSRYLTQNSFVLCMESVTAFLLGPLSFLVALLITKKHPLRHPFQMIVSLGQVYGLVLYYGTCLFDDIIYGQIYSRPEAYYYWGYYVGINFIWFVIPSFLIYSSTTEIVEMAASYHPAEARPGKTQTSS